MTRLALSRAACLLLLAALAQGCDADPTPGQIARCRADAGVTLAPTAKLRSLLLDLSAVDVSRCTTLCYNLLRDRQLDFVEMPRRGGDPSRVDRISLAPKGSTRCTAPFQHRPNNFPPKRYQFRAPRGQCIVIDEGQVPSAAARLQERRIPSAEHDATVREAVRADGTLLARVVDYRAHYAEAAAVTCADVIASFPRDSYAMILSHVTDRR